MFCEKCGAVISDGSRFCEKCGAPVAQTQLVAAPIAPSAAPKAKIDVVKLVKENKKIAIISTAVLLVVVIGLIFILQPATIDPADYLKITFSGYNGEGKLNIKFDPEYELCYKLLDITPEQLEQLTSQQQSAYATKFANIVEAFDMTLTGDGIDYNKMSNGDKIYIRITVDRDALKSYDYKFKKDVYEIELEVGKDTDPIAEPLVIDLFDILDITATGFEGYGELNNSAIDKTIRPDTPIGDVAAVRLYTSTDYERDWYSYINVTLLGKDNSTVSSATLYLYTDNDGNLKNGDTVKITVDEVSTLTRNGILLKETEYNYAVSGLAALTDINLFDYLKPVYSGFSNSSASVKWKEGEQTVKLSKAIGDISELNVKVVKAWGNDAYIYVTFTPIAGKDKVEIRFDIDVEAPDVLKNGDTITLSCTDTYDRSRLEKYGMTFAESKTITAGGITEMVNVDLLGALNCVFEGNNGSKKLNFSEDTTTITFDHSVSGISQITVGGMKNTGWFVSYYVTITYTDSTTNDTQTLDYYLNVSYSGYSSGDTVTISLGSSYVNKLAKLGINVTETERIVTIP